MVKPILFMPRLVMRFVQKTMRILFCWSGRVIVDMMSHTGSLKMSSKSQDVNLPMILSQIMLMGLCHTPRWELTKLPKMHSRVWKYWSVEIFVSALFWNFGYTSVCHRHLNSSFSYNFHLKHSKTHQTFTIYLSELLNLLL